MFIALHTRAQRTYIARISAVLRSNDRIYRVNRPLLRSVAAPRIPIDNPKRLGYSLYMTKTQRATKSTDLIAYTPNDWTPSQLAAHRASTLEEAFHAASCLAGGWYRRAVAIDMFVTPENTEIYMLRPTEVAPLADWTPCYEVKRLGE